MAGTKLKYSGRVRITTSKRKKTIKNTGETYLFNLVCKTLAGYPLIQSELPSFIELYAKKNQSYETALIQKIPVTRTYKIIDNVPVAVFTASIADTNLIELSNTSNIDSYELRLLDGTYNNNRLAKILIDPQIIEEISPGRQGLIEWELTINNAE